MNRNFLTIILVLINLTIAYAYEKALPTSCNPNKDKSCLVKNVALSKSIFETFTSRSPNFKEISSPSGIEYYDEGLKFTIKKRFENPTIISNFYILYGKVEVEIKAARGRGIISSFYLQSDDLDEIDVTEAFGGDPSEVQSNFFIKGNITTYDRGQYHPVSISPMDVYHKYGIEWNSESITWTLNDRVIRVVTKDHPQGYPSSPMLIKFSLWAGGDPLNEIGTIQWSKGETDYSELPYSMYIRNLFVSDYSTGSEYIYGNADNGEWVQLTATDGKIGGRLENSDHVDSTINAAYGEDGHLEDINVSALENIDNDDGTPNATNKYSIPENTASNATLSNTNNNAPVEDTGFSNYKEDDQSHEQPAYEVEYQTVYVSKVEEGSPDKRFVQYSNKTFAVTNGAYLSKSILQLFNILLVEVVLMISWF